MAYPPSIPARERLKDPCKPSRAVTPRSGGDPYSRQKKHYPFRRREENAARNSNFRKVIEVGPALCCRRSFRCRRLARAPRRESGARSARCYGGRRNATGATTAITCRRPRCFRGSTARCATTPSAGLAAADGECGANLLRPGAVVQRSGGGTRLDRRRQSGPVGDGVPRPAIAGGERALHSGAVTAPGFIHISW